MSAKRGLLERLDNNEVVVGDGGFVYALEKRGYSKHGAATPECVIEDPYAVSQLHREFLRAGSDVMQTYTFYATEDKLGNRGANAAEDFGVEAINNAACKIAHQVAQEISVQGTHSGGVLVAGGVCQTPSYLDSRGKEVVQAQFQKQVDQFIANNVDFLLAEYFEHIEEMEWAIETLKKTGLPVCASMVIGLEGDMHGLSVGECAIRMARAGADVVGVNCHYGPTRSLQNLAAMKEALDEACLKVHLMIQPLGYFTPDATKQGFIDLPEFPFALEPRTCTRYDIHAYARAAYEMGARFIGGCCGFEPYHTRAISEELHAERGFLPKGSEKHGLWGKGLEAHTKPWVRARARKDYWQKLQPASGRPTCASMSQPVEWGVTAGHEFFKQHSEETTKVEMEALTARQNMTDL